MALSSRDCDNQWIVTNARFDTSPRRQIWKRIGPAKCNRSHCGSPPAVGTTSHPMIGVAQTHAANPVLAAQACRAIHSNAGIQVAGTSAAIPTLERAKEGDSLRLLLHVDAAILNRGNESGKAIDSMRVDAIACGLGEEASAHRGTIRIKAKFQ